MDVKVERRALLLTLDNPLAGAVAGADHRSADTLYNLDACGAGFQIRGNHTRGNRRYGCLLSRRWRKRQTRADRPLGYQSHPGCHRVLDRRQRRGLRPDRCRPDLAHLDRLAALACRLIHRAAGRAGCHDRPARPVRAPAAVRPVSAGQRGCGSIPRHSGHPSGTVCRTKPWARRQRGSSAPHPCIRPPAMPLFVLGN